MGAAGPLAVGMIVGADWRYHDFNQRTPGPLQATRFVHPSLRVARSWRQGPDDPGGRVLLDPPRSQTGTIGAGQLHDPGERGGVREHAPQGPAERHRASGVLAAQPWSRGCPRPITGCIALYGLIAQSPVTAENASARNFRQTLPVGAH